MSLKIKAGGNNKNIFIMPQEQVMEILKKIKYKIHTENSKAPLRQISSDTTALVSI